MSEWSIHELSVIYISNKINFTVFGIFTIFSGFEKCPHYNEEIQLFAYHIGPSFKNLKKIKLGFLHDFDM